MTERISLYENPAPKSGKELWIAVHYTGDISTHYRLSASNADAAKKDAVKALGFNVVWTPHDGPRPDVYIGSRA